MSTVAGKDGAADTAGQPSSQLPRATARRLPPGAGETIDRAQAIRFRFDGRAIDGVAGDTVGSALAAAGIQVISRSFKYHRPRGLLCCSGHCPNCMVRVDAEPNVRACQRPAADGMVVRSQNAWPSARRDALAAVGLASRFLPVGFYYKTFIRPAAWWPGYERVLRRMAGLGVVDRSLASGEFDKQHLHCDVAVIGGGPAGLAAALAAAGRGANVLLFDENERLGGRQRFAAASGQLATLIGEVEAEPRIVSKTGATVFGWYRDNWLAAVCGRRLFKIRAAAVVHAAGAIERPLVFANNDLPGVMLAGAALRLARLYRVAPGRRVAVATVDDAGWHTALALVAAGVHVQAVIDLRAPVSQAAQPAAQLPVSLLQAARDAGIPELLLGYQVAAALGRHALRGVRVVPRQRQPSEQASSSNGADANGALSVACDLLAVSAGITPNVDLPVAGARLTGRPFAAAGAASPASPSPHPHAAGPLPAGSFVTGSAAGAARDRPVEQHRADGDQIGRQVAAFLGLPGAAPPAAEATASAQTAAAHHADDGTAPSAPPHFSHAGGKRFVCFCEDVTDTDIDVAIAEGYDSVELLKRYTTVSMGPCQGKMCSRNANQLCATIRGQSTAATGRTTARPPAAPVTLGALAGQPMEPVSVSPVHHWHCRHGARLMVAGRWLRPEHYGDPQQEVRAVRAAVGLIDVSPLGKLRLSGPGVAGALERVYINRWRRLAVGRIRYGVMCNDEGVILDDGVCAHLDEHEWYATTTSTGATGVYEWLQWWLQSGWGDGVHLTDLTEAYAAFNLAGPRSRELLSTLTTADLSNEALPYMAVCDTQVAEVPCRLLRMGFTGELSYELHCPAGYGAHLWQSLIDAGQRFAIEPFGVEAQRILRLEKGHIIVGQDTDALSDALAADLAWAVKLDKRDFLGKRELTRIAEHGIRQRLVGFTMDGSGPVANEGDQVVELAGGAARIVGWVTSSRFSPTLGRPIGLAWVPAAAAEHNGTPITLWCNGQPATAAVHHGAFYDPEGQRARS